VSRQSQTIVSQAHAVTPAMLSRSAPAHRSASNPKMGNQAAQRLLGDRAIQAKFTVNEPGDRFEQEADRVAEQVMRMTDVRSAGTITVAGRSAPSSIRRRCSKCSSEIEGRSEGAQVQRKCSKCEEELYRKPRISSEQEIGGDLEARISALRGAGQPFSESARAYFEPRFGQDFSSVHVHTGSSAAETAKSINALAYTRGLDIVFSPGQYQPNSVEGRKLLAHELTHVVQQGNGRGRDTTIRRTCNPTPIASVVTASGGCGPLDTSGFLSTGLGPFRFNSDCDDFAPGHAGKLLADVGKTPAATRFEIHGFASVDGIASFNENLGCARALKARKLLTDLPPDGAGLGGRVTGIVNHGPTPGPILDRRSVVIRTTTPPPPPPPPPPPTPVPPVVKPGPRTRCERDCSFDFDDCLRGSGGPLPCLAQRSVCLGACIGAPSAFEVCVRLLQPPVKVSGCNHAYVETPTRRYAIITPCTSQLSFADPIFGGVALKTDRSPDPCSRRPTCIECIPKPGVTDLERCFRSEFTAYAAPSLLKILGPNSNTFAGTLARACCDNMTPKPAVFGCLPGWDDPPAPSRSAPCPSGPPVC